MRNGKSWKMTNGTFFLNSRGTRLLLCRRMAAVVMGYWPPAADADCVPGNDQRGRELPSFEFVGRRFHAIKQIVNQLGIVPGGNNLFRRFFLFEVKLEDWIELIIRR